MVRARIAAFLSILCAGAAVAAPGPSLQLGTLPRADGATWRISAPIEGTVVDLDAPDARLTLLPSPVDDRSWIVLSGEWIGPVSGLLRVRDAVGHVHAISVTGEVTAPEAFDGLLLRGLEPGDRIERYVQLGDATVSGVDVPAARIATVAAGASGWTRLTVELPAGVGECDGSLRLTDHTAPLPLHVSLLESITVLGSKALDPGFVATGVRALRERLRNGRYTGRVGVLGIRAGTRRLRVLDAVQDGETVFLTPRRSHPIAGNASPEDPGYLSRVRHLGGESTGARFLSLTPGQATLVNPLEGILASRRDASLLRLGAARESRLSRNRLFAITGTGDGEWFLSGLSARRLNGTFGVRQVRYTPSLQGLLGGQSLRIGDIASIRYPTGQSRIRENLLVSVGEPQGPLRIVELVRDGMTVRAHVRRRLQIGDPAMLPAVQMDVLGSPRAGSAGLPVQVRVIVPRQELRVFRVDEPGSWSLLGRETLGAPAAGAGVGLATPSFLLAGPDGQGNTDLIRYAYDGQILQARALGRASGLAVRRHYVSSARRRHAWLVGTDRQGRARVAVATNGLEPGTNLPPIADAGPDISTTVPRVRLRARVRDADGDPIAVRWLGDGVEFTDRFARRTFAFVPPGRTQIRVRAREARAFDGSVPLEDIDALVVRFDDVVSTGPGQVPGLVTTLGRPEPNPTSTARTVIPFTLATRARVRLEVFDVNGRSVRTLLDETLPAGGHDARWDGTRADGCRAAGGVYFVRLLAGDRSSERRIVLVR